MTNLEAIRMQRLRLVVARLELEIVEREIAGRPTANPLEMLVDAKLKLATLEAALVAATGT